MHKSHSVILSGASGAQRNEQRVCELRSELERIPGILHFADSVQNNKDAGWKFLETDPE
jgi:hypothetical protein